MLIIRLFIPIFLLGFVFGMLYMSYSQKVMLDKGQLYNIFIGQMEVKYMLKDNK